GVREEQERGTRYQFAHPRVRALIYRGIDDTRKHAIHLFIADALIRTATGVSATRIADHFNAGSGPFEVDPTRRDAIAHYNLLAAREALLGGEFQSAFKYCRSGLALFPFQTDPDTTADHAGLVQ